MAFLKIVPMLCSHDKWGDTEWNPGDILRLTAFSLLTQGSNFTPLRGSCTHFSNRERAEAAGMDGTIWFPMCAPDDGSIFEKFHWVKTLEFSEDGFIRWNELSGQKEDGTSCLFRNESQKHVSFVFFPLWFCLSISLKRLCRKATEYNNTQYKSLIWGRHQRYLFFLCEFS